MEEKGSLNFIAIDFETANTSRNSACSVGLVRFENGIETDWTASLIRPPSSYFIRQWTEEIHHICWDDVYDKPTFDRIWADTIVPFLNKTPDLPLVAHNAIFDMNVLRGCLETYGIDKPELHYFDSLPISRRTWREFRCHKLTYLGMELGIDYLAHDALEDSRTCGLVIVKAAEVHNAHSVEELLAKCKSKMKVL